MAVGPPNKLFPQFRGRTLPGAGHTPGRSIPQQVFNSTGYRAGLQAEFDGVLLVLPVLHEE